MKHIIERAGAPTPPFFRKIRNLGLLLTAISAAILTAPVFIPAAISTVAGYLALGGAIATSVSQLAVYEE